LKSQIGEEEHHCNKSCGVKTGPTHRCHWDGKIVAKFSDDGLKYPGNIVFDGEGRMLVCGYMSNSLHLVSQDCVGIEQLLGKADGLDKPATLGYDRTTNRLYVGMKANELKVFQLSSG